MFSISSHEREPARLNKKETDSSFKEFCDRIAPYVLIATVIIFSGVLSIALAKYGANLFSTPTNRYEHLNQIVGCKL